MGREIEELRSKIEADQEKLRAMLLEKKSEELLHKPDLVKEVLSRVTWGLEISDEITLIARVERDCAGIKQEMVDKLSLPVNKQVQLPLYFDGTRTIVGPTICADMFGDIKISFRTTYYPCLLSFIKYYGLKVRSIDLESVSCKIEALIELRDILTKAENAG